MGGWCPQVRFRVVQGWSSGGQEYCGELEAGMKKEIYPGNREYIYIYKLLLKAITGDILEGILNYIKILYKLY